MERRTGIMVLAGLFLTACLCLCLGGGALLLLRQSDGGPRALAPLRDLCAAGGGVAGAAVYEPGPGLHPAAILVADPQGAYRIDGAGFNSDWQAQTLDVIELAVCIDAVSETVVERCEYALADGTTGVVRRIAVEARFRVLAAHNGQELLRNSGISLPRECEDEETFAAAEQERVLRGHLVEAVAPAVGPLIAPASP